MTKKPEKNFKMNQTNNIFIAFVEITFQLINSLSLITKCTQSKFINRINKIFLTYKRAHFN